jgi:hypothetical protein
MKTPACIFLVLACAIAPLFGADTIELKQRWIAGKQYFFTAKTTQQSTITVGPQKMEQGMTMSVEMNLAVRLHEDGQRKRLVMKNDRMAMEMSMNGQKMNYDSAKPDAATDPMGMGKTLSATLSKELKMLTNEKDEIVEIENYDEYIQQVTSSGGAGAVELAKSFTREGLLQTMKQGSLQSFPAARIAPGEAWPFTNKVTLPQIGEVTIKGTYTYKGMVDHEGKRCAEIQTSGIFTMDLSKASGPGLAALGMKVTGGSLNGPVWFDPQLGAAVDSDLIQEMTMTMKSPADPATELTIPMKQTIKTTLTKIENLK